ncbi:hypothetical protein WMY93_014067 [Mugilogobius chulae]|uniref:Uncharacterized protein n=1 Tax=Mugilogobius chulae TaxID=88201 RepID=A0AAW0NY72_9GOBI
MLQDQGRAAGGVWGCSSCCSLALFGDFKHPGQNTEGPLASADDHITDLDLSCRRTSGSSHKNPQAEDLSHTGGAQSRAAAPEASWTKPGQVFMSHSEKVSGKTQDKLEEHGRRMKRLDFNRGRCVAEL